MFGIRDFLFGKKVKVIIPSLGIFETRVKKNKQQEIIWTCDANSAYENKEVALLLLGNTEGPYQSQIENAQFILKEEESIKLKIIDKILKDTELQQQFKGRKIADFHLTCIYPWKAETISNELSFESKINDGFIGVIYKDKKMETVFF